MLLQYSKYRPRKTLQRQGFLLTSIYYLIFTVSIDTSAIHASMNALLRSCSRPNEPLVFIETPYWPCESFCILTVYQEAFEHQSPKFRKQVEENLSEERLLVAKLCDQRIR